MISIQDLMIYATEKKARVLISATFAIAV